MAHTFDLVPESGALALDDITWRKVQFHLFEFHPAKRVTLQTDPDRIRVRAYGEQGDAVAPGVLVRLEELCGSRLHQVPSYGA